MNWKGNSLFWLVVDLERDFQLQDLWFFQAEKALKVPCRPCVEIKNVSLDSFFVVTKNVPSTQANINRKQRCKDVAEINLVLIDINPYDRTAKQG